MLPVLRAATQVGVQLKFERPTGVQNEASYRVFLSDSAKG